MTRKMFFGIVFVLVALAILFGFLLPMLMSAESTMAVVIALSTIAVAILSPIYHIYFNILKKESK